jgi:hypothetical protein
MSNPPYANPAYFNTLTNEYENPNPCKNETGPHKRCGCHGTLRLTAEDVYRGNEEISRRLNYVIKNREALGVECADGNLHLAPGDDSQFPYKQPPWMEDGSVNPAGVWVDVTKDADLSRKHSNTTKWKCTKCGAHCESFEAREMNLKASKEVRDQWWWCFKCKQSGGIKAK